MYGSCFRNSWYVAMDEWSSEKVVTNIMIEDKEGQKAGAVANQIAKDEKSMRAIYDAMYEDAFSRNIAHLSGLLTDDYVLSTY